jgi:uncharacterized membrane protein YgcG
MPPVLTTGEESAGQELELTTAELATKLRVRVEASALRVIRSDVYTANAVGQARPVGAVFYALKMWAGGAGGGGGGRLAAGSNVSGGSSGGGGGSLEEFGLAADFPATYNVTVATGGKGGSG